MSFIYYYPFYSYFNEKSNIPSWIQVTNQHSLFWTSSFTKIKIDSPIYVLCFENGFIIYNNNQLLGRYHLNNSNDLNIYEIFISFYIPSYLYNYPINNHSSNNDSSNNYSSNIDNKIIYIYYLNNKLYIYSDKSNIYIITNINKEWIENTKNLKKNLLYFIINES